MDVLVVGGGPARVTAALQVAELQPAFPTFTDGAGMAAKMIVGELGVRPMPQTWSSLGTVA
jgi:flavin-dependent dehydrogenase